MSMGKKKNSTSSKSRSSNKRRKPKFLSLSLEINSEKKSQPLDQMRHVTSTASTRDRDREENQQLNLFPLHPENLVDEKEENNVALFFSGTENTDTTLTGLLTCSKDEGDSNNNGFDYMTVSTSEASLSYADTYRGQQGALVRTAIRSKERENGEEEKWVVYSDVVDCDQHSETTRKDEEVSSCSTDHPARKRHHHQQKNFSLKLDYEEILNAWSDKGSLYLQSDSSQIVPDIHDDFLPYDTPFSSQGLMYRVPEVMGSEGRATENLQEEELKVGRSREASVLRYKEKRQNRLFAKRIRYEVRKLNAEKRPRVKGRFVKRN